MTYIINKSYNNTLGLDLRSNDLLREPGAASSVKNLMYRQTGALSKRKGFQLRTTPAIGGLGMTKYNNLDIASGVNTEELLSVDDDLHLYTEKSFTLTYTGSDNAYYDMYVDSITNNFFFDIYEGTTEIYSGNLGTGQGSSDLTVDQLVTALNALSDFTASVTGSPSVPAAFIPVKKNVTIESTGTALNYYEWVEVDTPTGYTTPFSDHYAARNGSDFENATFAQINDILLISNGYDDLHKYDGNRVYKVGLPKGVTPTDGGAGAGGSLVSTQEYKWTYTYVYTDAKENVRESENTDHVSYTTVGGGESRDIVVSNIQQSAGFNTAQATVDGAQSTVNTITVDVGHGITTDDFIYIQDGVTSSVVRKQITSTTATTLVFGGDSVTVGNNDIISCVKIVLRRTISAGTVYYVTKELINDTGSATQTYDDGTADTLTIEFVPPIKAPNLPPKCKYIDTWRGQVILTGNRTENNTVYYSDIVNAESFPQPDNSFTTSSRLGGANSGVKSLDNALFIFKPESIIAVTGDLGLDSFRVDNLSSEGIGCVSHNTLVELEGRIWFLGRHGVYAVNSQGVQEVSSSIKPRIEQEAFVEKQTTAYHWIDRDLYVLCLTKTKTDSGSNVYFDTSSAIMVFDLFRRVWVEWDNINMMGGLAEWNDRNIFSGRALDPVNLNAESYTAEFLEEGVTEDYADHQNAVDFSYKSHWETLGEASVFKKFLRIKVLALDGSIDDFESDEFTVTVETEHDYLPLVISLLTLDFSGGEGWGNGAWGEFPWGESRLETMRSKLASKKAKALRTIISNSIIHENVLISGYELEVATPFDIQMKE